MSDFFEFDEPNGELRDEEYPEDEYLDDDYVDDESTDTVACPECGAEVYEDAVRCPVCGTYITTTHQTSVFAGRPLWWIALAVLGILAVIVVLAGWGP